MCLLIFALNYHPDYKLVLLANRDEFYARPTAKAHEWDCAGKVIAGKDLQAGGTWLGIDKKGRFSAITNYRDPKNIKTEAPSRGELVQNYLLSQTDPLKYMFQVQFKAQNFNGFNLLVGNREDIFYYSNYAKSIQKIGDGIHGLSNHLLNTYWYKVGLGKEKLENYLNQNERLNIADPGAYRVNVIDLKTNEVTTITNRFALGTRKNARPNVYPQRTLRNLLFYLASLGY